MDSFPSQVKIHMCHLLNIVNTLKLMTTYDSTLVSDVGNYSTNVCLPSLVTNVNISWREGSSCHRFAVQTTKQLCFVLCMICIVCVWLSVWHCIVDCVMFV